MMGLCPTVGQCLPYAFAMEQLFEMPVYTKTCRMTEQITTGGDYVLAVKDNQPRLAEALCDVFSTLNVPEHCRRQVSLRETLDKGHGRIEHVAAPPSADWTGSNGWA